MHRADHWLLGIGSQFRKLVFQPFPSRSESAKRIVDANAPVGTGDEPARFGIIGLRQTGLVQTECTFDDAWNAVIGRALALLIFEGIGVAAFAARNRCLKCSAPMMPRCFGVTGLLCFCMDASSAAMPLRFTFSTP